MGGRLKVSEVMCHSCISGYGLWEERTETRWGTVMDSAVMGHTMLAKSPISLSRSRMSHERSWAIPEYCVGTEEGIKTRRRILAVRETLGISVVRERLGGSRSAEDTQDAPSLR